MVAQLGSSRRSTVHLRMWAVLTLEESTPELLATRNLLCIDLQLILLLQQKFRPEPTCAGSLDSMVYINYKENVLGGPGPDLTQGYIFGNPFITGFCVQVLGFRVSLRS